MSYEHDRGKREANCRPGPGRNLNRMVLLNGHLPLCRIELDLLDFCAITMRDLTEHGLRYTPETVYGTRRLSRHPTVFKL